MASISTGANGLGTITHPIAFPTAKLKVLVSVAGSGGAYAATWDDVSDVAGNQLTATRVRATLSGAVTTAYVQAIIIGY
ncbi:gp53-like domain-containing protein [Pseudomonas sp. MDT1-85]